MGQGCSCLDSSPSSSGKYEVSGNKETPTPTPSKMEKKADAPQESKKEDSKPKKEVKGEEKEKEEPKKEPKKEKVEPKKAKPKKEPSPPSKKMAKKESGATSPLKKQAQKIADEIVKKCKSSGSPWEDPDFPASNSSLFMKGKPSSGGEIEWKRCADLHEHPELFVEGVEAGDVIQGSLGDCYFLGAISVVATRNDLLYPLFLNAFPEYGFYQVKFFKDGEWVVVTIDDRLPTRNGRLIYGSCKDANEFWVPLLEKAYAKVHRCYEALESGSIASALTDLTGEGCLTINWETDDKDWKGERAWKDLQYYIKEEYLMGCAFHCPDESSEEDTGNGILCGHAYSLLDAQEPQKGLRMVKLRNPWGKLEWKGKYSDDHPSWTKELISKLKAEFKDDGTFWMTFEDWQSNFNHFIVLRLLTDTVGDVWNVVHVEEEWKGKTAGGCMNNPTWIDNPQYILHSEQDCSVIIHLAQPDMRKTWEFKYSKHIGVYVIKSDHHRRLMKCKQDQVVGRMAFTPARDVTLEVVLKPQEPHVLIPCAFDAGLETRFWMNVYSQKPIKVEKAQELIETKVSGEWKGSSAGGCFNNKSWVDNPLFLIQPSKTPSEPIFMACSVKQHSAPDKLLYIGIYGGHWEGKRPTSTSQIQHEVNCSNVPEAFLEVTLSPEDWPLFVLPNTFDANLEGKFDVVVRSTVQMKITKN